MMIQHSFIRSAIFTLLAATQLANAENTNSFAFALMGDLPYGPKASEENPAYTSMVKQINADKSLAWVLHVGDIKTGATPCSNALLQDRKERFEQFSVPFILTPGDNEWTDCHRESAGSFDPLERLTYLRKLFFSHDHTELHKLTNYISIQAEPYRENIIWEKNNIVFTAIHLVGSRNGEDNFSISADKKRTKEYQIEVKQRTVAAIEWLRKSFAHAMNSNAKGIFIAIHANPGWFPGATEKDKQPFNTFLQILEKKVQDFAEPVTLAHGDSHIFRIDKPRIWNSKSPALFTRVETFGYANGSWIKVTVNPDSPEVFSYAPVIN